MNAEELDNLLASCHELDAKTLADLVVFAHMEVLTRDVEPWADLLQELYNQGEATKEEVIWLLYLYNSYDNFNSAWSVYRRWPSLASWNIAPDKADARDYQIEQERRNLFGGRILLRHQSYADKVGRGSQELWMAAPLLEFEDPGQNFEHLTAHMRTVTQVGRQAAYEWAEFMAKVVGFPVDSEDGQLFESSGPRRSLERIYGNDKPTPQWLNWAASQCKKFIEYNGVALSWFDFETIICDFEVGRRGRYFTGRHLQALKEEIHSIQDIDDRMLLLDCFHVVVPEPWSTIPAGIDKSKLAVYRDTGRLVTEPWW